MDDYDSDSGGQELKSKYNSAIAQLYRLDNLWKDCHNHSRNILYTKWHEDLDRIWLELYPDVNSEGKKKFQNINEQLLKTGIYGINPKMKKVFPSLHNKVMNLQKQLLMKKEAFLRDEQQRQGKGGAYDDEQEEYMD